MFVRGLNLAISMSPDARKDSPGYIGKLRGDVSQLRYVVYDDGLSPKDAPKSITAKERARHLRQQLADVSYTIVPGPKKTTTRAAARASAAQIAYGTVALLSSISSFVLSAGIAMVLLDIAPTLAMYRGTNEAFARSYWHWFFLIRPQPLPEMLIQADPAQYLKSVMGARSAGMARGCPRRARGRAWARRW